MAQSTNLNVSPYFDDFNADDNYYKVLFKPGLPVQARELTGLQSILQDQISKFGQHIFKEGAKVIPGNTSYFKDYFCVEINNEYLGVTVESYIDQLIGRKIVGLTTGVTAVIVKILKSSDSERNNLTLYIKYHSSNVENNSGGLFDNGELLAADVDIISGPENSTFIPSGEAFASTVSTNSTSTGAAYSISEGVYFVRGTFVNVNSETILLSQYSNTPTGRIGLRVLEETVNSDEDSSLTDNSKGFNNFAAPGADRLKISCSLFFKGIDDLNDDDFVELASVRNGELRTRPTTSQYNILGDELARRTFAESGDYTVKPYSISVKESLNDDIGNNGVFFDGQSTDEGSIASEETGLYQVSAGRAFVKGYEIENIASTYLDFEKPRTEKTLANQRVNYNTGSTIRLNNQQGAPEVGIGNTFVVSLRDSRVNTLATADSSIEGNEIGVARVYDFALESGSYNTSNSKINEYDISLFDIQTFTTVTLNQAISLSTPAFIEGKYSGATGFLRSSTSTDALTIYDKSGELVVNEPLIINGIENSRIAVALTSFGMSDVKSLYAGPKLGNVGAGRSFVGDVIQKDEFIFGNALIKRSDLTTGLSTITSSNPEFPGKLKKGNLLKFGLGNNDPNFAKVTVVGTNDITVSGVTTVTGICDGGLPEGSDSLDTTLTDLTLITSPFAKSSDDNLFTEMPKKNISNVDLTRASLTIRKTFNVTINKTTDSLATAVDADTNETFLPFDEERYCLIRRVDGVTEVLTSDKFTFTNGGGTLQINNIGSDLSANQAATLIATLVKTNPKSKVKRKERINTLIVDKSRVAGAGIGGTTLNDGLTHGSFPFGTRVQDKKISLNTPDVIEVLGIYESTDTSNPSSPKVILSAIDGQTGRTEDLIVGEKMKGTQSGAVAIYAEKLSDAQISFVYLNDNRFKTGETINFQESNVGAIANTIDEPSKNISANFSFNTGQKNTIYDHGFITRKEDANQPSKKIKIYFENAYFEAADEGDITTANSYNGLDYGKDVQSFNGVRNTDLIDIRPRVSNYSVSESSRSPLEFFGRTFNTSGNSAANVLASDESILTDFSFYLGRIDRIFLTKYGKLTVQTGTPAENPDQPVPLDDSLEIASVTLPPYLYDVSQASLSFLKHKRYRMQDIRKLETRIRNLEYYTSLSLLETATSNLFVSDADGLNKFKSGFFVDNFTTFLTQESNIKIKNSIDTYNKEARPSHYTNSIDLVVGPVEGENTVSNGADPEGTNIKLTGTALTLDYSEVEFINQPFGTRTESVTPFLLNFWKGAIDLTPASDTWVDTVRLEAKVIEVEGNFAKTIKEAEKTQGLDPQTGLTEMIWQGWQTVWTGTERNIRTNTRTEEVDRNVDVNSQRRIETSTLNTIQDTFTDNFRVGTSTRQGSRELITETYDQESLGDRTISKEVIPIMRSRNIAFEGKGFKPQTRVYGFFDGVNVTKHCVPKLLEINMKSGVFQVGETVTGTVTDGGINSAKITFRVAVSNHKEGPYNSPTRVYATSPYTSTTGATQLETYSGAAGSVQLSGSGSVAIIPSTYSSTSTILNIDIISLSEQAQGAYFGQVTTDMVLKGNTSGAEAVITDVRLISDFSASVFGSFFIPDPNIPVNSRFETGKREFRLTDSQTNDIDSSTTVGSDVFEATGTLETVQENILSVRNAKRETLTSTQDRPARQFIGTDVNTEIIGTQPLRRVEEFDQDDPLAQSFFVSENSGVYITSCEVYFSAVDDNNVPVQLDIRTLKLGVPSQEVLPYSQILLDPDQITTSSNGSVATKFTFKSPVYLSPATEYAICMLSASAKYRVFISRIGENDLITDEFVSNQPTLGSLFKSQNASTWEPSQWEDLKFKLNRAQFVTSGSAEIYSPILGEGNAQIPKLLPDSLRMNSKKIRVGISSAFAAGIHPTLGNTIYQTVSNATGDFVGSAGIATGDLGVIRAGLGYTPASGNRGLIGIALTTITGSGRNATANVHFDGGVAVAATISNGGIGYQVGDIVGISTNLGINARLSVASIGNTSELILENIQGEFATGAGSTLMYGNTLGNAGFGSAITGNGGEIGAFIPAGTISTITDGLHIIVNHKNHGMYHEQNRVIISGVESDILPSKLSVDYAIDSTDDITVDSSTVYSNFENVGVASTNPGYVKIGNEIIRYEGVSGNTLTGITRQQDSTLAANYTSGLLVEKYELNGVSLRRINQTHNLADVTDSNPITFDSYKIKLDMGSNGIGRTSVTTSDFPPRLFLNGTKSSGGSNIRATQNMPFEVITPMVQNVTVPGTSLSANLRTVSGTSVNTGSGQGSDTPFIVQPTESIALNQINYLNSPRIIASRVNEINNATITVLPGDRSLNMTLDLSTTDSRISPFVDTERMNTILTSNRVDKLITNFTEDSRVDTLTEDPSSFLYISKENTLETSATSIKIILDAHINEYNDIRAFFSISENQGSEPIFIPFPGFDNLNERGQVVALDKSDGRPDSKVSLSDASGFASEELQYKEYTFSITDLPSFKSFRIKLLGSSTNQAYVPRFRSLKVIALA